ncbi:DUF58 domain-containing protein [Halostella litorea]|uniref:DUF58 domain-containing protein n=1 Tax=Halostella litorea TaxID=2528831 RepID=UPI001091B571|nr:DUF58 domain-containing protein [Halostella litorea]
MLTRRGWGLLGVVVGCLAMATAYGARSLNAVMVPGLIALVAAVVQVARADRPSVTRGVPADGFVGERRTVTVDVAADAAAAGVVTDRLDAGLGGGTVTRETTVGGTVSYDVTLEARGEHRLGPASVAVTDVLGLARRAFDYRDTDTLLAYPPVYGLTRGSLPYGAAATAGGREEFDHLREYDRGDSTGDVHWKSSAKRPDDELLVREFVGDEPDAVSVVAETADDARPQADAMATAAASVSLGLLDRGVPVAVDAPAGNVPAGDGPDHRTAVLSLLARTGPGSVPADRRRDADVVVTATDGGVDVAFADRRTTFDALVAGEPTERAAEAEVTP